MFDKKKHIIYISKNKLKAYQVGKEVITVFETEYSFETLENILPTLKKKTGNNVRLLIDDEFVYVVSIIVPSSQDNVKDYVADKAQEIIPVEMNDLIWDFKEVLKFQSSEGEVNKVLQVMAVDKNVMENISRVFGKAGITAEAVESVSMSLARLVQNEEHPLMVITKNESILLTVIDKGLIIFTETVDKIPDKDKISQVTDFISEHFGINLQKIIISFQIDGDTVKSMETDKIKADTKILNPVLGLGQKTDIRGEDRRVLNLVMPKVVGEVKIPSKTKSRKNILIVIILLVILIIGAISIRFMRLPKKEAPIPAVMTVTPTVEIATVSATPNLSQYSIQILNGTKKEGEAGKLKEILTKEGFYISKTGNASKNNYNETELNSGKNISQEFINMLDNKLKVYYSNIKINSLEALSDNEVVIIIGGL